MPKEWHDRHSANKISNKRKREFYRDIVADKKPYFMRYIYPPLMKQYNTYIKNTNKNALREFQMTVEELYRLPINQSTERQREFIKYFEYKMPVSTNDCVMNKICRRFESEFDGHIGKHNSSVSFNYRIMRGDAEYAAKQYTAIKHIYDGYNKRLANYSVFADYERVSDEDSFMTLSTMSSEFKKECIKICPNRDTLCNIILDICYTKSATRKFAWSMCGADIIHNLLKKNNNLISYPTLCEDGDITFAGDRFIEKTVKIEVIE